MYCKEFEKNVEVETHQCKMGNTVIEVLHNSWKKTSVGHNTIVQSLNESMELLESNNMLLMATDEGEYYMKQQPLKFSSLLMIYLQNKVLCSLRFTI